MGNGGAQMLAPDWARINPLLLDEHGALAVDARIVVDFHTAGAQRYAHMAIHPYPTQAEVVKKTANAWRKTTLTVGKKKFLNLLV